MSYNLHRLGLHLASKKKKKLSIANTQISQETMPQPLEYMSRFQQSFIYKNCDA